MLPLKGQKENSWIFENNYGTGLCSRDLHTSTPSLQREPVYDSIKWPKSINRSYQCPDFTQLIP